MGKIWGNCGEALCELQGAQQAPTSGARGRIRRPALRLHGPVWPGTRSQMRIGLVRGARAARAAADGVLAAKSCAFVPGFGVASI